MKKLLSATVVTLALLGCATVSSPPPPQVLESGWLSPEEAILLAANEAPRGVPGTFAMRVQATGTQGNRVYLNSELDYRDQRNLTVALTARAARQMAEQLGANPLEALNGRDILVAGAAVRTKIHFIANGRMTDKYYYQTHVNVTSADQISIR